MHFVYAYCTITLTCMKKPMIPAAKNFTLSSVSLPSRTFSLLHKTHAISVHSPYLSAKRLGSSIRLVGSEYRSMGLLTFKEETTRFWLKQSRTPDSGPRSTPKQLRMCLKTVDRIVFHSSTFSDANRIPSPRPFKFLVAQRVTMLEW